MGRKVKWGMEGLVGTIRGRKTHLRWNLVGEVGFHPPSPKNKIGALMGVGSFRSLR